MVYVNSDGTLNEAISDRNDSPFTIEQPEAVKSDSVLKVAIASKVTLNAGKIYSLDGYVYVDNGGELYIPAGTIIIGDTVGQNSAICVNRGGKIFANGTKDKPVIFTSSAAPGQRRGGDWGGLLICGKASTNHPGGEAALEGGIADQATGRGFFGGKDTPDDNDNSGVVEYARIEFAGIAAAPNQELNSLTLGAVGRGTKLEHIQITYANDDAIEWFGGTVDVKYAVINGTLDDDLDTDNGYSGRVQFVVAQRYKDRADASTSECFESDNNSSGSTARPLTSAIFSNITSIGPLQDTSWTASATGAGATNYHTRFGAACQIRRNSRESVFNSIFIGWPRGLEILSSNGQAAAAADSLMIRNNSWFGIKGEILRVDGTTPAISTSWVNTPAFNNTVDASTPLNANLSTPFTVGIGFNPLPKSNANFLNTAKFDNGNSVVKINDSFFEPVSYRGAFSDNIALRWDLPWCEYDPVNKDYTATDVNDDTHNWALEINVYPNPTSDFAKILYQIPTDDIVSVRLFDAMGNLVDTIAENINQVQGYYEFSLNTNNLPIGNYYVQVMTNKGITMKNFNVVR